MAQLKCVVVTPEATAVDLVADKVILPLADGEIGIFPKHAPMIGRLGYGEMRIHAGDKVHKFYVDGGFVQVSAEEVSVLTGKAIPADQLDIDQARDQLAAAANAPASTEQLAAIKERNILQARGQIRTAQRAG